MNSSPTLHSRVARLRGVLARKALVRTLFQAAWIGGLLALGLLALDLWRGWRLPLWLVLLAGLGLALLYSAVDLLLHRPNMTRLARRLDQRLDLHEQVATALDVEARVGPRTYLDGLLLGQAQGALDQAEERVRRMGWFPRREAETLLAVGLLAVGVYFMLGQGMGLPSVAPRPLPPLSDPAAQQTPQPRLAPRPGGPGNQPAAVPAPGGQPDATRRALEALADALGDQAVTAAAAEALRQGDVSGAADALRRLADQANSLSPGARRDLSQALRQAGQATRADAPRLSEQLRRSASDLERGGTQAQRGLEDLARELERQGQASGQQAGVSGEGQPQAQAPGQGQGQGQGQGGQGQGQGQGQSQGQGQGGQGQGQGGGAGAGQGAGAPGQGEDDRAGAEGVPVELAAQPDSNEPTTRRADPNAETRGAARGGQFTQGGAPGAGQVEAAADLLRYPWDLRGVVQEYFTPTR